MNNLLNPIYLPVFLAGFLLTAILTRLARWLALKLRVLDIPDQDRKIHRSPTPLLGGMAIFASTLIISWFLKIFNLADFSNISAVVFSAIWLGGLFLMIGGFLDDKYNLKPKYSIVAPILAVLVVLMAGLRIGYITNPFGGPDNALVYLADWLGIGLLFLWLMGMMYTTKLLDGLDGLVSGLAGIASLMIFLLSLDWDVPLSATSIWALALAGGCFGFLLFNFRPAKIFLGDGGGLWLGFMLGVLSVVSGSKIATTLLVIGIPALDVLAVIVQRLWHGESPFSHADRKHLHYRLLDAGWSHRGAVLLLYLIALVFGAIAVFADSFGKLVALVVLAMVMIFLLTMVKKKIV